MILSPGLTQLWEMKDIEADPLCLLQGVGTGGFGAGQLARGWARGLSLDPRIYVSIHAQSVQFMHVLLVK
jgi:hypothetical protein